MSDDADLKKKEAFAKKPDTTGAVKVLRPQNGAEYLDSLRDGREVYHLRRARQGRHDTSRLPQHRAG